MKKKNIIIGIVIFVVFLLLFILLYMFLFAGEDNKLVTDKCDNLKAGDCLISKIGSFSDLRRDEGGNSRYVGANPKNYVDFNDESDKWRIIGSFKVIDENGKSVNRLKIIRESIGNYSYDFTKGDFVGSDVGDSRWGVSYKYNGSDLMNLLNNGPYYNSSKGNCYTDKGLVACDFSSNGLKSSAYKLIGKTVWNLGAYNYENAVVYDSYLAERGMCVLWAEDGYVTRDKVWTGYVGLMYPSDYGYASNGGEEDSRSKCLKNRMNYWKNKNEENRFSDCVTKLWLYSEENQWTMSPNSGSLSSVFAISMDGTLINSSTHASYAVRPVVYLSEDVKITGGDGTVDNPYTLSK